jgi:acetate kinase
MSLILVLNAGSSSVKFALFDRFGEGQEASVARGAFDGIGQKLRWSVKCSDGKPSESEEFPLGEVTTHKDAIARILRWIDQHYGLHALKAAGHRVVHGGADFETPVMLNASRIAALRTLVPLAPLHQPHNLAAIESLAALAPDLPQIACFDTAFHTTVPDVARNFALPRAITAKGVRRYGFHGISYHYIADELRRTEPNLAKGRVLVAHLGNGASLCAMLGGKSIATTMGFSAIDGLMMGTRTGSIDPAVIFYLIREEGMSAAEVESMLYNQSGLLGVSGLSSDMRRLREEMVSRPEAREAIGMFTYRIIREAGSMIAALGGIDALVFTAGIGEHDAQLRADVIKGLSFAGFSLDAEANTRQTRQISGGSGPTALVIPTNEELMIARETAALLSSNPTVRQA